MRVLMKGIKNFMQIIEYQKKYYAPKKQNTVGKKSWNEIVSICSELGISYGEAVARGII